MDVDVFVSYARADLAAVRRLTEDVELGGHQVWFDRDLHGGEDWWARILDRIRLCSVLVFAVSQQSLRSQACRAELDYAQSLGVPVLPIQVGEVESLATSAVAAYQVIDYRQQSSALGYRVMSAIAEGAARRGPLPDPLPAEPEVPFAYLSAVGRRLARSELRSAEQAAIIGQLRHALRDEDDHDARADARQLLTQLRRHPECTYANAGEIDTILGEPGAPDRGAPGGAVRGPQERPASPPASGVAALPRPASRTRIRMSRSRWALVAVAVAAVVAVAVSAVLYNRAPTGRATTLPLADPTYLAVSPDGSRLYVTNYEASSMSVLDARSVGVVGSPVAVGQSPFGVAVSPDGRRVYVANYGVASVSVVDTGSGATVGQPTAVGQSPWGVAVSPDGRRVYVANSGSDSVSVLDAATGAVVGQPIAVGKAPAGVAVSPDGRRVYVANSGAATVSVIDTGTGAVVGQPVAVGQTPWGVAVSPDGRRVYVVNSRSDSVSVLDPGSTSVVATIVVGSGPVAVAVSPDSRRAYVTNYNANSVSVVDAASDAVVGSPIAVGTGPQGVAVSPDGYRLFVADDGANTLSAIDL